MLCPRRNSTIADLLRLAACWLAGTVLVQGLAAAYAIGAGPWHRHRDAIASVPVFQPADHAHRHDHGAARHHHAQGDASVLAQPSIDGEFDAAALALAAAFALMAVSIAQAVRDGRRHVQNATLPWHRTFVTPAMLRRPPRSA